MEPGKLSPQQVDPVSISDVLLLQHSHANNKRQNKERPTFRSGIKTATVCVLPGDNANSVTPSTCNLSHGIDRSSLLKNWT